MVASLSVCISGELRHFELTGAALVDAVQPTLPATWVAAVNVPALSYVPAARSSLREVLPNGALVDVRVLDLNRSARCSDTRGLAQALGLVQCWTMLRARGPFTFTAWLLRTRPDVVLPWRFVSLPTLRSTVNLVVAGYVGGCACPAIGTPRHCAADGYHGCVEDNTALIHGVDAQRAYLQGYYDDFAPADGRSVCSTPDSPQRRHRLMCPTCREGALRGACGECKLGATLAARSIRSYGLAPLFNTSAPAIVRKPPLNVSSSVFSLLRHEPVPVTSADLRRALQSAECSQCAPLPAEAFEAT